MDLQEATSEPGIRIAADQPDPGGGDEEGKLKFVGWFNKSIVRPDPKSYFRIDLYSISDSHGAPLQRLLARHFGTAGSTASRTLSAALRDVRSMLSRETITSTNHEHVSLPERVKRKLFCGNAWRESRI